MPAWLRSSFDTVERDMTGLSEDCCAYAPRPMTSNAGATICGTRMYSGLSFVPDICDFRVSLIAAFSEFTPSTPSLTAEPTIDDSNFILHQMVQNQGRIQEIRASSAILLKELVGASGEIRLIFLALVNRLRARP